MKGSPDGKILVCPCEDVLLDEIDDAIARGYRTMEEIKRATGVTTGVCQGRQCLAACVAHVAAATGASPDAVGGITHRPPARPVPLGAFAAHAMEAPR